MILAFLYRQRGMHEDSTDTTESRLFYWVFPMLLLCSLVADLYGFPKWWGIISALLTWGGLSIGHSFAQSNGKAQYAEMGLVCFTRLEAAFLPFLIACVWGYAVHWIFWIVIAAFFFLTWGVSALSYSSFFQSKTLRLFGVNWCVPGDSSWEEWLIGLCYDLVFWAILGAKMWGIG